MILIMYLKSILKILIRMIIMTIMNQEFIDFMVHVIHVDIMITIIRVHPPGI